MTATETAQSLATAGASLIAIVREVTKYGLSLTEGKRIAEAALAEANRDTVVVTIHHLAFHDPLAGEPGARSIRMRNVPDTRPVAVCDTVFRRTNAPEEILREEEQQDVEISRTGRCYSTSVGDVVHINADGSLGYYVCDAVGWVRITAEQFVAYRKACLAGRRLLTFDVVQFIQSL